LGTFFENVKKYAFLFINEPLVKSYFTPGSISTNEKALITAQEIILKKHFLNRNKVVSSKLAQSIGIHACLVGDIKKGRKYFLIAIRQNRKKIVSYFLFLFSFFGVKMSRFLFKLFSRKIYRKILLGLIKFKSKISKNQFFKIK